MLSFGLFHAQILAYFSPSSEPSNCSDGSKSGQIACVDDPPHDGTHDTRLRSTGTREALPLFLESHEIRDFPFRTAIHALKFSYGETPGGECHLLR